MTLLTTSFAQGTHAARPAAASTNAGRYYWETDTYKLFQSTGSAWTCLAGREVSLEFIIDGSGVAITTGVKLDLEIPFDLTLQSNTLLADVSGAIVVDLWVDTYANYPPTVADTICAAAKPTIAASGVKSQDSTLTGWTVALSKGSTMRINVDSCATITRCLVSLKGIRTGA